MRRVLVLETRSKTDEFEPVILTDAQRVLDVSAEWLSNGPILNGTCRLRVIVEEVVPS